MKSLKLRPKTIIAFLAIGIIPCLIISIIAILQSSNSLKNQAFNQLISLRDSKKAFVEDYFTLTENQLISFSRSKMIIDSMNKMRKSFTTFADEQLDEKSIEEKRQELIDYYESAFIPRYKELNGVEPDIRQNVSLMDDNTVAMQYAFITENPNQIGEKHLLDSPSGFTTYGLMHKNVHSSLREYLEKFSYYDIFLIDIKSGNIVYSVAKEMDFGTNLNDGPFANSGLGKVFQECQAFTEKDQYAMTDYAPYFPSFEDPAGFIAMPIYKKGDPIGVLAFQLKADKINSIMNIRVGLGTTGETYLIGSDHLMRSDSVLRPETHSIKASFHHPETGKIETAASDAVLNGETAARVIKNEAGKRILSAYTPIQFGPFTWGLMTEIQESEAFVAVGRLMVVIVIILVIILVLSVIFAVFFANTIVSPLKSLSTSLIKVGEEVDFSHRIQTKSADEIGMASHAFNGLMDSIQSALGDIIQIMEKIAKGDLRENLSTDQKGDIQKLNTAINESIDLLGSTFARITDSSEQVAANSAQLATSAQSLASGSSEQAANIEETSSSLTEIESQTKSNSENARHAQQLTAETLQNVQQSVVQMDEMLISMKNINDTSADMAKIIKVIDDIAFQTNLLALNAAVEAARAGKYGKGFAVVAEEVRNLAGRSAEAAKDTTELIENSVRQIENGTKNADKAAEMLKAVTHSTTKIDDTVQEIAAASGDQTKGISEVNVGMNEVNRVVQQNSSISEETSSAAEELQSQSNQMLDLIGQFKLKQSQVSESEYDDSLIAYDMRN